MILRLPECLALFRCTYFLQGFSHDVGAVVDGQDDVRHTSSCQTLDLMENHGTIGELYQWFRQSEGLAVVRDM